MPSYPLKFTAVLCVFFTCLTGCAAPANSTQHIHLDQFGYRVGAPKVAVIADPQTGYNAAQSFNPGSTIEVRRWGNDSVVFSGAPTAWSNGATQDQSGDKCWWFDFSSVNEPGLFYLYSPSAGMGSDCIEIADDVYRRVAVQAVRMFFYQRCAQEKKMPYVNAKWSDSAAFMQDKTARLYTALDDATTERDVSGGWFDAGDYNKYVTFARGTLQDLLLAYEDNPTAWGDDHGIPESGNGIPDILDEVKWELDWLLRMQLPNGSLLSKVGTNSGVSPPSATTAARFYGAASSSATRTGADAFAHAAIVFRSLDRTDTNEYAAILEAAAKKAWTWAEANPAVLFNNVVFTSADPEVETDAMDRLVSRVRAACKLYALTGDTAYRDFFDENYRQASMFDTAYYISPYDAGIHQAILYYLRIPGGTQSVKDDISSTYAALIRTTDDFLPAFSSGRDAYRAWLGSGDYTWGSNSTKSGKGGMFAAMLKYGLDTANADNYREAAAGFLHYMHGVNPNGITYLSNMSAFGAERSVTQFYHTWFGHGTDWDSTVTSPKGPPPGYLTGGPDIYYQPDASYTGPRLSPPMDQPAQKSYKDWNTSWPENSWEVTEPAIYYQAAYIHLLSSFLPPRVNPNPSRLVALAARAMAGTGDAQLIPGIIIQGSGKADVIVRALGPTLAASNVTNDSRPIKSPSSALSARRWPPAMSRERSPIPRSRSTRVARLSLRTTIGSRTPTCRDSALRNRTWGSPLCPTARPIRSCSPRSIPATTRSSPEGPIPARDSASWKFTTRNRRTPLPAT
ncbi:MAG: glycoside hydrolase family 9 protein [Opitutaceae bacterium]|jgi:hypothetical protein